MIQIQMWKIQVDDLYRENMELVHSQYPKLDTPVTLESVFPLRKKLESGSYVPSTVSYLDKERQADIVPVRATD